MCRAAAEGGRRCPGGHSTGRDAQTARQRLSRARRALAGAEASGDPATVSAARTRVEDAENHVKVVKILAGADRPDLPNHAGLRRAEREALSNYTGGEFMAINTYVRNGYQLPRYQTEDRDYVRHMRATVAALKRAVNRSKLDTPARAIRSMYPGTAENAYGPVGSLTGQVITEDRFASATLNDAPLKGFGDVTLTYDLAPGTRALAVNDTGVPCNQNENELLIGPHQSFRVVSDRLVDGQRVIHLQSVPEHS